jgi:hypothetical protein
MPHRGERRSACNGSGLKQQRNEGTRESEMQMNNQMGDE